MMYEKTKPSFEDRYKRLHDKITYKYGICYDVLWRLCLVDALNVPIERKARALIAIYKYLRKHKFPFISKSREKNSFVIMPL